MIVFDKKFQQWFDNAVKTHSDQEKKNKIPSSAHFLIGSFADDGDIHVAHIARCPLPATATDADGDTNSKLIDDQWIVDNADKVIRLLPGGINLVGLVWLSNKDVFAQQKPMLSKTLTRISRTTNSLSTLNMKSVSDNYALVAIETPLGKPQGFVVDVANRGPQSPVKVSFSQLEWVSVVSRASGTIGQNPTTNTKDDFYSDFVSILKPWATRLFECDFILLDGVVRDNSEPLFKDLKKRKKGSVEAVMFLDEQGEELNEITSDSTRNWYDLVFDIEVRAAVPVKSTVKTAIEAVKQHVVRNLCARAVLHYESMELVEDSSSSSNQTVHQMPRPATTTLPSQPVILFSDFLFEADTVEDAQKNIQEILEVTTSIDHVDDGWERALEVEEMEAVRAPGAVPDHAPLMTSLSKKPPNNTLLIVALSAIVLIVAILMYIVMGK